MREPKGREWPLVVFTVGLQMAAGMACLLGVQQWRPTAPAAFRFLGMLLFPMLACAIVASLFHLGRPIAAWRALRNGSRSRLTAELLVCVVFAALAFLTSGIWTLRSSCPWWLSAATAGFGILGVIASARIYQVPARPWWNSQWTMASFLGSMLLLGGVAGRALAGQRDLFVTGGFASVGALLLLISSVGMLQRLFRVAAERYVAPEAYPILRGWHWFSLGGAIVFGCIVPLAWTLANRPAGSIDSGILFALTITGVVLARTVMVCRGIALSKF